MCVLSYSDNAYQGFASGDLDADAAPVRLFMQSEDSVEMLVACSFSKNMGLCKCLLFALTLELYSTELFDHATSIN
jgi:aspartate/tyrosine/aromatic aminotransferase